ncbi:restriction endonuclease fold toxin 5 domain-containing protein [Xenorhabdus entomophaga]|uniref:restriction endonuclease fold toxin 5 domain-containing protein n=1 Tax=Xenorhabdus entomophaga TaxID=3136257 RepID=UPI0030F3CFD4
MPIILAPAAPAIVAAAEWTIATCAAILVGVGVMESTKDTTADDIEIKPKKPKIRTEGEVENDIKLGEAKAKTRLEDIVNSGTLSRSTEKCKKCPASTGIAVNEKRNFGSDINSRYQLYITNAPSGPGWIQEWTYATVSFDGFQHSECLLQETKGAYDQFFTSEKAIVKYWSGTAGMVQQARTQNTIVISTSPNKLAWYFMEIMSYTYFTKLFRLRGFTMDIYHKPMI